MKIEMNLGSKTLKEGFEEFIKYSIVRDCTESTLINYKTTMRNFNKFCPESTPLNDITKNTIEDYICYLRENTSMSNMSISIWLQRLKAVLNYLHNNDHMEKIAFPIIRCEKKVKEVYTDDELAVLLKKPSMGITAILWGGIPFALFMSFLWFCYSF